MADDEAPLENLREATRLWSQELTLECNGKRAKVMPGHIAAPSHINTECMCPDCHLKQDERTTLEEWVQHAYDDPSLGTGLTDEELDTFLMTLAKVHDPGKPQHGQTLKQYCCSEGMHYGGPALAGHTVCIHWYDQPHELFDPEPVQKGYAWLKGSVRTSKFGVWFKAEVVAYDDETGLFHIFYHADNTWSEVALGVTFIHWGPKPPSPNNPVKLRPARATLPQPPTPPQPSPEAQAGSSSPSPGPSFTAGTVDDGDATTVTATAPNASTVAAPAIQKAPAQAQAAQAQTAKNKATSQTARKGSAGGVPIDKATIITTGAAAKPAAKPAANTIVLQPQQPEPGLASGKTDKASRPPGKLSEVPSQASQGLSKAVEATKGSTGDRRSRPDGRLTQPSKPADAVKPPIDTGKPNGAAASTKPVVPQTDNTVAPHTATAAQPKPAPAPASSKRQGEQAQTADTAKRHRQQQPAIPRLPPAAAAAASSISHMSGWPWEQVYTLALPLAPLIQTALTTTRQLEVDFTRIQFLTQASLDSTTTLTVSSSNDAWASGRTLSNVPPTSTCHILPGLASQDQVSGVHRFHQALVTVAMDRLQAQGGALQYRLTATNNDWPYSLHKATGPRSPRPAMNRVAYALTLDRDSTLGKTTGASVQPQQLSAGFSISMCPDPDAHQKRHLIPAQQRQQAQRQAAKPFIQSHTRTRGPQSTTVGDVSGPKKVSLAPAGASGTAQVVAGAADAGGRQGKGLAATGQPSAATAAAAIPPQGQVEVTNVQMGRWQLELVRAAPADTNNHNSNGKATPSGRTQGKGSSEPVSGPGPTAPGRVFARLTWTREAKPVTAKSGDGGDAAYGHEACVAVACALLHTCAMISCIPGTVVGATADGDDEMKVYVDKVLDVMGACDNLVDVWDGGVATHGRG